MINVYGTRDRTVPGNGDMSSDGWYYLAVADVQTRFALNNGCNIGNGPFPITTSADGTLDWQCTGYQQGNNCEYVMQCNYDGNHNYPKLNPNNQNSPNFAMPVVWAYFQNFVRDGTKLNVTYNKYYNSSTYH